MPLEAMIYVCGFLCAACAGLAVLRPEPAVRLPGPMLVERRRNAFWRLAAVIGTLLRQGSRHTDELRGRLLYAGSRVTVEEFRGVKLVSVIAGCVVAAVLAREFGPVNPGVLLLGGMVGFVAPDLQLRSRVAKRQRAILRLMPEVIDLLLLCIGAGLDFLVALNKVVAIPRLQREPLIGELSLALQEIKLGKRRAEALRALAKRVNLPELSSFLRTIVQADRMGTPISEVLANHAEDLRLQRFLRAERAALQAPIKILGPLIFCIMPCVAIIVGAPVFLQFMRQNPFGQ